MIYIHEPALMVSADRVYSRVIANSEDELQEFGEFLGLQAEWVKLEPRLYFEVYGTKLLLALSHEKVQYLSLKEFEDYFTTI
jgi:hypothetical protein